MLSSTGLSQPKFSGHSSACFCRSRLSSRSFSRSLRLPRQLSIPTNPRSVQTPTSPSTVEEKSRGLFQGGDAISSGMLPVAHGHSLYYEVHGKKDGPAALFLHGGPGAGCHANHARFFDPDFWRVVLVDQRGCGRSTPQAALDGNTTQGLIEDIECLRDHLSVSEWVVLGGSWGVALGLAYAIAHPSRVSGIILRGICTMRKKEIDWMFRGGAAPLFPQGWKSFLSILSEDERQDPLKSYHDRLTSSDTNIQQEAASYWRGWEMSVMFSGGLKEVIVWQNGEAKMVSEKSDSRKLGKEPISSTNSTESREENASDGSEYPQKKARSIAQPLLECHYSVNAAFLEDNEICDNIDRIREIPCIGVQGRLDFVCPVQTAFDLSAAWPEMELRVIPGAGHSMYDVAIVHEIVEATDRMKALSACHST